MRDKLARWHAAIDASDAKVAGELMPLRRKFVARQTAMVLALDQALARPGLDKTERRTAAALVCRLARGLILETGDAALQAIHDRHCDTAFEPAQAAGPASPGAIERPSAIFSDLAEAAGTAAHKQTGRQQMRDARQALQAAQTGLSLRQVYRRLASALHPDREIDPAERARKTALMQRVNQAHDRKDLLHLLELKREHDQRPEVSLDRLPDAQLGHYNRILKEQVVELEREIASLTAPLEACYAMAVGSLAPASLMPLLMADIAELKRALRQLRSEQMAIGDLPGLKALLDAYRRASQGLKP